MSDNINPLVLAAITEAMSKAGEKKVDWTNIDTPLDYGGKKIMLPADPSQMPIPTAIDTLKRVQGMDDQEYETHELVAGAPWDAAVAIYKAMQKLYGVVMPQSTPSWFGPIKPQMVSVKTGPGGRDVIQVPTGEMNLPGVKKPVSIHMHPSGTYIIGTVRRADRAILVQIAELARDIMRTDSVYRGKAIRLGVDDDGTLDLSEQPEFLDLSRVAETDVIHTAATEGMIRTNVLAPIKNTEACRKHRIPLKRGILLEGPYGTGKSLTARVVGKVATDNSWTFIILDRAQGLKTAIEFARTYQPCVIFAEDIDRAADREDESVNDLVNMLDGLITKDQEMMVILTTNFIEKIDRSLLRPGRFDAVISIQVPDSETAVRLIHAYGRELVPADIDLTNVGEVINGWIPATVREVVERAKLAMLVESRTFLTSDDLYFAAVGMQAHMALLNRKTEEKTTGEKLADALKLLFIEAASGDMGDGKIDSIDTKVTAIDKRTRSAGSMLNNIGVAVQGAAGSAGVAAEAATKTLKEVSKIKSAVR